MPETVFALDPDTGWVSPAGTIIEVNLQRAQDAVMDAFERQDQSKELTAAEIKDAVTDIPNGTISKALDALVTAQKLGKRGAGKRGDPYIFYTQNMPNDYNGLQEEEKAGYSGYDCIDIPGIPRSDTTHRPCVRCSEMCLPDDAGMCVLCAPPVAEGVGP